MTRRWLSEKKRVNAHDTGPDAHWPAEEIPWPPDGYWSMLLPRYPSQPWVMPAPPPAVIPSAAAPRADAAPTGKPIHAWVPYTPPPMITVIGIIAKLRPVDPDTVVIELSAADYAKFKDGDVVTIQGTNSSVDGEKVMLTKGSAAASAYQAQLAIDHLIVGGTISKIIS